MQTDLTFVEHWTRRDVTRWIAGAIAGVVASVAAMVLAIALSASAGMEDPFFPVKLMATLVFGHSATEFSSGMGVVAVGFLCTATLAALLGAVFAHFTYSNAFAHLFFMGLVWGVFTWVFVWCLFLPSFNTFLWAGISAAPAFFVCVLFGVALSLVGPIYKVLGGNYAT